jgi:ABC-2 type transport system ATP-binding protein
MGFLGPNGAGKTTVIKMIMGFLSTDGGDIEICGYNVKKNYEDAMALVGGIVENPDMYKQFSGRLNLDMYARAHGGISETRIKEIIQTVGLQNRINDKVKKYSLGMKQRLGLAMALIHKPRLLILDEPTNGLDPAGIKELRDILKKVAHEENVAVLVSSHQLAEMQLMCDRVTIISNGKIICEKSIDEIGKEEGKTPRYVIRVKEASAAAEVIGEGATVSGNETIIVNAGEDEISGIISKLAVAGVAIFEVKQEESSLEDAYMEITKGVSTIV